MVRLIDSVNEENQFKKQSKILVFSPAKTPLNFLKRFFKEFEFEQVQFHDIEEKVRLKGKDILFFNDESHQLQESQIVQKAEESQPETLFFYFGKGRLTADAILERTAYANSRVQLYSNLMNALRYQSLLDNE